MNPALGVGVGNQPPALQTTLRILKYNAETHSNAKMHLTFFERKNELLRNWPYLWASPCSPQAKQNTYFTLLLEA